MYRLSCPEEDTVKRLGLLVLAVALMPWGRPAPAEEVTAYTVSDGSLAVGFPVTNTAPGRRAPACRAILTSSEVE